MTATERAIKELELAGLFGEDSDYGGMLGRSVKELLEVFARQRHSGASAAIVNELFYRLVDGQVLTPLTGKPEEWEDCGAGYFQNKRMFSVFARGPNGEDGSFLYGVKFVRRDGAVFTSSRYGSVPVSFPCMPTSRIIREGTIEAAEFPGVFEE